LRFVAVLTGLFLAGTSAAQAHLPYPFHKHQTDKQKLQTIKLNLPHVCASTRAGCNWLHGLYRRIEHRILVASLPVVHYPAWRCIHRYEGSWQDSGDPYWGGLQMDRGFMARYAPRWLLRKGLANSWTPREQMGVAERAYLSGRGFWPWPNTARMCGLL
jgi:hypothetical protein